MTRASHPLAIAATLLIAPRCVAATFQSALEPAGVQAEHVYDLWLIMLGACTLVFVAIAVAVFVALWRAPRATEATPPDIAKTRESEPGATRAVAIAGVLSVVGLLGLLLASVLTDRALAGLPLENGVVIEVTGQQWWWQVTYDPEDPQRVFETANEIHVPVGRPVIMRLKSPDVIHGFWVPNLAPKKDLIPGRTLTLQFRADKPGTYRGQCAEFCGFQHAKMAFLVIAEEPEVYERWAQSQRESAAQPASDTARRGQEVFLDSPCVMCHTVRGTTANAKAGPDLTHLGSRRTLAAGTLSNTRGNLAGWISDPHQAKPGVNMPAVTLPAQDLQALVTYLESLK